MKENNSSAKFLFIAFLVILGLIIGVALSFGSAVAIKATSDKNYCGSCHSMKPMIEAYSHDVHGGANPQGIEVKCVDCHLPHDGVANYIYTKAKAGINDVYGEYFKDTSKIDWEKLRKEREHYTYDSACLACHTNLKDSTESNLKTVNAHRSYFLGQTEKTCVGCHKNVGHKDLGLYLKQIQSKE